MLSFLLTMMSSAVRVVARRLARGPARPGWSASFEVFREGLRRTADRINALPPRAQAAEWQRVSFPNPVLREVRFEPTTVDTTSGPMSAEWVVPAKGITAAKTILYFHGGWYSGGSLAAYRELMARVALASGARVLTVDYRLAPEHPYPAAVDDAIAAWRWVVASGVAPSDVVIGGDSAGAGLSVAAMLRLRDAGEALPASAILICPWVDLATTGGTLTTHEPYDWASTEEVARRVELYVGERDPTLPEISPVFAELRGLPPLFVQAGGAEMLLDQEERFVKHAREAGVDVTFEVAPDMIHDWHLFAAFFPEGRDAIARIGAWVA